MSEPAPPQGPAGPQASRRPAWLARLPLLLCLAVPAASCGRDGTGPSPAEHARIEIDLRNLPPLDPDREGGLEVWVTGPDEGGGRATLSAGRIAPTGGALRVSSPVATPVELFITVEPPGDTDGRPSAQKLLGGTFSGRTARLSIEGIVTGGPPLEPDPGSHALFTPSNNAETGYPSHEDAGIWLFNQHPNETVHTGFFLTFTPLAPGWTYEGWAVRDFGAADACWLSYGKFAPDIYRKVNSRDDTGLGPFSGQIDYVHAMPREIEMPGDDWISNPHGYPVPCGLDLPVDLNGNAATGVPSRWTHVITIEPASDTTEAPYLARPFLLRPYRNPFGQGPADEPRVILHYAEELPSGTARITG